VRPRRRDFPRPASWRLARSSVSGSIRRSIAARRTAPSASPRALSRSSGSVAGSRASAATRTRGSACCMREPMKRSRTIQSSRRMEPGGRNPRAALRTA
jgi:hypothetical protein